MTEGQIRQRLLLFQGLVLLAFVALTVRLWQIQILGGANYQRLSEQNSLRSQQIDAPRGVIYDRQGRILVRNRPNFRASLLPASVVNATWQLWSDAQWEQAATTLGAIARTLNMPYPESDAVGALRQAFEEASGQMLLEDIGKICQRGELLRCFAEALVIAPYDEVTVQADLAQELAFAAMENSATLPSLTIIASSQREYRDGPLYSHLLGYELPISEAFLTRQTRFSTNPYLPTDRIGMAGIEAGYEEELRGVRGTRVVEENVVGEQIRIRQEQPATPGHNVFLDH